MYMRTIHRKCARFFCHLNSLCTVTVAIAVAVAEDFVAHVVIAIPRKSQIICTFMLNIYTVLYSNYEVFFVHAKHKCSYSPCSFQYKRLWKLWKRKIPRNLLSIFTYQQ